MNIEDKADRILAEFRQDGVTEADIERYRPYIVAGLISIQQKHSGYDC